jgi:hypothetical protein
VLKRLTRPLNVCCDRGATVGVPPKGAFVSKLGFAGWSPANPVVFVVFVPLGRLTRPLMRLSHALNPLRV